MKGSRRRWRSAHAPGTRLVRQWGDRVHLVNVETNGYEYHGARYQSLSEIARLITGTRWSGPLFFGIKRESAKRPSQNWKALLQADWHGLALGVKRFPSRPTN